MKGFLPPLQCLCKPGVVGRKCRQCARGFFDLSAEGCRPCRCDPVGSLSPVCDDRGRRVVVEGYGDLEYKCTYCKVFPSLSYLSSSPPYLLSRLLSFFLPFRCICLENVVGEKCSQCKENMFGLSSSSRQCFHCPACYNLIEERVTQHRLTVIKD